jgi:hypothetical protein
MNGKIRGYASVAANMDNKHSWGGLQLDDLRKFSGQRSSQLAHHVSPQARNQDIASVLP